MPTGARRTLFALACAVSALGMLACGGGGGGGGGAADTTPPTVSASLAAGLFNADQDVTLTANEAGTIYYTIDGTNPTTTSTAYTAALHLTATTTLKFMAVDTAGNASAVQTRTYTIDKVVPTVTANPAGGSAAAFDVVLTASESADIYYTVDGSAPTEASAKYTAAIPITVTTTLKFIAIDAAGNESTVETQTYTIQPADTTPPTVAASVPTGLYKVDQSVTLSADEPAAIYYTTDGSTPSAASTPYTAAISISVTTTLKFMGVDTAGNPSGVTTVTYTIDKVAPTVSAAPAGGLFNADQSVVLTASEAGDIYYTTNGSAPTTSSAKYTAAISLSATTTLKFMAVDAAGNASAVGTQTYTIDKVAPTVSANPVGGTYNGSRSVSLTASETADIYYTTNGTDPTTASTKYTAAVSISATTSLKFIAVDTAGNQSSVTTENYTINPMKTVSGTVNIVEAGAAKAVATNTTVEVKSYKPGVAPNPDVEVATASMNTGGTGSYAAQIAMTANAGYLVVRAVKEGFTESTQRVDLAAAQNVTVNLGLQATETVVAQKGQAMKSSGTGGPAFKLGVVRYADGSRRPIGGASSMLAAKAAGGVTELEITVPVDSLPEETETLVGKLRSYDPNDSEDARNFPGDYLDSNGNRLLSVAFDFIQITDQDGTSIGSLAQAQKRAGKAASEPTRVQRWIPTSSCQALTLGDAALDVEGFQVPVYTLNRVSGIWDLLGEGTIAVWDGAQYAPVPVGDVTPANCEAASTTGTSYYLDILVTNEDFLRSWWNLDYPLVFEEPKQVCVDVTFATDKGAVPPSVSVNLEDDDVAKGINNVYGYTDGEGKVRLNAVMLDNQDADRTAKFSYWNPYTYDYVWEENVALGDAPNCTATTVVLVEPPRCAVNGKVVNEAGQALPGQFVSFYGQGGSYYYNYAYTNDQGLFDLEVACEKEIGVYVGWEWTADAFFNANGALTDFERTDQSGVVALKDVVLPNNPPSASGYLASYAIRTTGQTSAYLYAWDWEGDYPLAWALKDGATTIRTGTMDQWTYWQEIPISGLAAGDHDLRIVVTDAAGKSSETSLGLLSVTAPAANRPPIVQAWADRYMLWEVGEQVEFSSSAWDMDGDALTYEWRVKVNGLPAAGQVIGSQPYLTYTVPQTAALGDTFDVELTVSDGQVATAVGFTLTFGNPAQVEVIVR